MRQVLGELMQRGCALIVVTHNLAEVADLATRVGFLSGGRLLAVEAAAKRDASTLMRRLRDLAAG